MLIFLMVDHLNINIKSEFYEKRKELFLFKSLKVIKQKKYFLLLTILMFIVVLLICSLFLERRWTLEIFVIFIWFYIFSTLFITLELLSVRVCDIENLNLFEILFKNKRSSILFLILLSFFISDLIVYSIYYKLNPLIAYYTEIFSYINSSIISFLFIIYTYNKTVKNEKKIRN